MIRFRTGNNQDYLDQWYSTQEDYVFYENQLIFKADKASFVSLTHKFGKDRSYIFYKGEVLHAADYHSFRVDSLSGIGKDETGLKIYDSFDGATPPVYYLEDDSGIICPDNTKLSFGMSQQEVARLLGSPWEIYTSHISEPQNSNPSLSEISSHNYRHLGLCIAFNAKQELVHFRFKPDYDHRMGCKLFLSDLDIFNTPVHSLEDIQTLGFEIQPDNEEEIIANHPDFNLSLLLYSGGKMNLPSGQEIYPEASFFIVDCQLFSPKIYKHSLVQSL